MLNLEVRQFVLFIVFQVCFCVFCGVLPWPGQTYVAVGLVVASGMVLIHLMAIHFKMLLLAKYFKGLEKLLTEKGQKFVTWDTHVLPEYIFHWGNFFFIPAATVGIGLIAQFVWMTYCVAGLGVSIGVGTLLLGSLLAADFFNLIGRFRTELVTFVDR